MSITKRIVNKLQVRQMVARAFGKTVFIVSMTELTEGLYNSAYLIELSSGQKTVLKVAPDPKVKVLTYEENIMSTEVSVLEAFNKLFIPVPKVLFFDESLDIIDSPYFFMTYLEGVPLNTIRNQLTKEEFESISYSLGVCLKRTGTASKTHFGEINNFDRMYRKWSDCFKRMISDLFDDAEAIKLPLSIKKEEALSIVETFKTSLDRVRVPTLVHKDIWEGNIFVDISDHQLTGIIDCERAINGEPLLEAVCGFLDTNTVFMEAYYGKSSLDGYEKIRVKLYKFYLFLLMVVEMPYREYTDMAHMQWTDQMFKASIHDIRTLRDEMTMTTNY